MSISFGVSKVPSRGTFRFTSVAFMVYAPTNRGRVERALFLLISSSNRSFVARTITNFIRTHSVHYYSLWRAIIGKLTGIA